MTPIRPGDLVEVTHGPRKGERGVAERRYDLRSMPAWFIRYPGGVVDHSVIQDTWLRVVEPS